MNFFEKILEALDGKMIKPTLYGWFHIVALVVMIALIVLVVFKCRKLSDKAFRIIVLSTALTLIVFEIYKQLNFSYNPSTDTWGYQWYAFPFQFCSSPMYVLLLIALLKEGKFRNFLCSFMATFGLFAGIGVMLFPSTVFIDTIGINIQTMVHHGSMVVMGVLMYVSGRAKLEHKTILKGTAVFGVLVAVALAMNIIFHYAGDGSTFNMFFIGPFASSCDIPVANLLYTPVTNNAFMWVVFLIGYFGGFMLCGYIMLLIAMLIATINKKVKAKKENKEVAESAK